MNNLKTPLVAHPGRLWTHQELFDNALRGVRRQGYKTSEDIKGTCAYRDHTGTRACGIGWSMPDELYGEHMDNGTFPSGVEAVLGRNHALHAVFPTDIGSMRLMVRLQQAHDGMVNFGPSRDAYFERNMQMVAQDFCLVYTAPEAEDEVA